jgi:hypothetical protein
MDPPVLTAVISVSGTLFGAIVGGCLTMYSNFFLIKLRITFPNVFEKVQLIT